MSISDSVSSSILHLVDRFGMFAIFFGLILDSSMLLPFVPGELLLIVAVQRFAHSWGELVFVIIVCTAGTVLGSLALFLLAKYGGRQFILKHPRLFMMNPERRDKLERTFRRPIGQSLVFLFRLFPFTRIIVSLPAGLAEMGVVSFLILTSVGLLVFNGGLMWFVYESRQPDSKIVAIADYAHDAFVVPAWDFVLTNTALVAAVIIVIGIFSLLRRSFRMLRNPDVPTRNTVLGTLSVTFLFWGGVVLIAGVWTDPVFVYTLVARTGWDIVAATDQYFLGPVLATAAIGLAASMLALFLLWFLHVFATAAQRRRDAATAAQATTDGFV